MPRIIEEPVTLNDTGQTSKTRTTHPAFGQIVASRVSGHTPLYASDFVHQHYMTVRIATSTLNRGLNRDWHYAGAEFIEVAMTEAQWATFVSSPNMGSGVPCTIQSREYKMVPGLPDPQSRTDQFGDEVRKQMEKSLLHAKEAIAEIDAMGLPKGKAEKLKSSFNRLIMEMNANLPFVANQFDEHMEDTVEKAKQEAHGYMTSVLTRAGLESLTGPDKIPLQIEEHRPDDANPQSPS